MSKANVFARSRGRAQVGNGEVDSSLKAIVWRQFGAAIDMLENAMTACPESVWADASRRPQFWYVAYHALFFLDYYLSDSVEGFMPPTPFTLDERDPAGVLPDQPYMKVDLLSYVGHGRRKCRSTIQSMSAHSARERCRFPWGEVSRWNCCSTTCVTSNITPRSSTSFSGRRLTQHPSGWPKPLLIVTTAPRWQNDGAEHALEPDEVAVTVAGNRTVPDRRLRRFRTTSGARERVPE